MRCWPPLPRSGGRAPAVALGAGIAFSAFPVPLGIAVLAFAIVLLLIPFLFVAAGLALRILPGSFRRGLLPAACGFALLGEIRVHLLTAGTRFLG